MMKPNIEIKGIIFDMDNTLLRSKINFNLMKQSIYRLLADHEILPSTLNLDEYTASTLIEQAKSSENFSKEVEAKVWEAVTAVEQEGMAGADLEPGVKEVLTKLHETYPLIIYTNNSGTAALAALRETGIDHYFEHIVGREQMDALKPSPSGIHFILSQYKDIPDRHWLMVGDSWIDGKAAQDGGVVFIAYQGNSEEMERKNVYPMAYIERLRELFHYVHA
jgi:phosphoglycolate phosphatase